jgi:hypothetical protein
MKKRNSGENEHEEEEDSADRNGEERGSERKENVSVAARQLAANQTYQSAPHVSTSST